VVSYGIITDEKMARDFFDLVQDHLYRVDSATKERRPLPRLDMFARRGVFIAAISAYDDDKLVGLYVLTDHVGKAHIDAGYVVSKYRRLGIGYELLDRSFRHLYDCGRRPVFIDIRTAEMVRLVLRLREAVPANALIAAVSLDPSAKNLKDDLYE
jgi:ribosomal protein S18 acetylase RimI-like enzyme